MKSGIWSHLGEWVRAIDKDLVELDQDNGLVARVAFVSIVLSLCCEAWQRGMARNSNSGSNPTVSATYSTTLASISLIATLRIPCKMTFLSQPGVCSPRLRALLFATALSPHHLLLINCGESCIFEPPRRAHKTSFGRKGRLQ